MDSEIPLRIVLVAPPPGVDFGIQRGAGSEYATLFLTRSTRGAITFDFSLPVAENPKDGLPSFRGPLAQGPPARRFLYVDVGTYAGQTNTPWSRRMKIPLQGITWQQVGQARKP